MYRDKSSNGKKPGSAKAVSASNRNSGRIKGAPAMGSNTSSELGRMSVESKHQIKHPANKKLG